MSELERVNEAHGDALKRAKGDTQVALSILAHQLIGEQNENERLREGIASSLTSLETGPMRDGYAYAVLAALQPKEEA